ncbi:MAG: FAD binding domain-containing protein [Microbacteriaceae bacterium]
MDLNSVTSVRVASVRAESVCGDGERPLAGGSWLYSEPQPGVTGLVDLMGMAWPAITETGDTLEIAATCTIAELTRLPERDGWLAHPLIWQCATSLLGSFKIWNTATVGGNIALALPAGPMTALCATLDASALIWRADGTDYRMLVTELVTGNQDTALRDGDIVRSLTVPVESLRSRTGFRRISLSPQGRSGTLVTSRLSPSAEVTFTVTAGTTRPRQFRFTEAPSQSVLADAIGGITEWFTDAHGAADWRQAMSVLLAEELRVELVASASEGTRGAL